MTRNTLRHYSGLPKRYSSSHKWGGIIQTGLGVGLIATGAGAGAGAGMIASGVGNIISSQSQPEQQIDPVEQERMNWIRNRRNYSINNRDLNPSIFFETGGKMQRVSKMRPEPNSVQQAPGGELRRESSNAMSAHGQDHEEGGIQLPGGEIEDDEMLVQSPYTGDTQVHSDELGYAEQTEQLAKYKGSLEQTLQEKASKLENLNNEVQRITDRSDETFDRFEKNRSKREAEKLADYISQTHAEIEGIKHEIANVDAQIEQVYQMQEQEAEAMGLRDGEGMPAQDDGMGQPEFQTGGNIATVSGNSARKSPIGIDKKQPTTDWLRSPMESSNRFSFGDAFSNMNVGAEDVLPFMSNIYNAYASRKLDNIDSPQYRKASTPTLDANYNVAPQQRHIQAQSAAASRAIQGNVSSAPIARASHANIHSQNIDANNQLMGQKFNVETQIRNQNLQMAAQTEAQNIERDYADQRFDFQRDVSKVERESANVANIESKLTQRINQDRMLDFQKLQMDINMEAFKGTSIPATMIAKLQQGEYANMDDLLKALDDNNIQGEERERILSEIEKGLSKNQ